MALTPRKARKMLNDNQANGNPLTDAQKRLFGARAAGEPIRPPEIDGIKSLLMKKPRRKVVP